MPKIFDERASHLLLKSRVFVQSNKKNLIYMLTFFLANFGSSRDGNMMTTDHRSVAQILLISPCCWDRELSKDEPKRVFWGKNLFFKFFFAKETKKKTRKNEFRPSIKKLYFQKYCCQILTFWRFWKENMFSVDGMLLVASYSSCRLVSQ